VASGLRVYRLDWQELRGDEAFGYFFSQAPWAQIIESTLALREPHPVASYFLQQAWLAAAGHSEFALRFLSAGFGVLAVALIYRLGRRLGMGTSAALLAAALLAISPYAIWHSQDARMYTISLALTLASVVAGLEGLRRGRWPAWVAYVVLSWLALHVHYFAAFVLVALNLYALILVLLRSISRRTAAQWLASQAALGLAYLPWLLLARETLTGYQGNGDSPGFVAMLQRSLAVFGAGESVPASLRTALAILGGALLVIGVVRLFLAGPSARRALLLLILYLGVPLLATWVSAWQRPIFNERYLIAAAPPFYLLTAAAVLGYNRPVSRSAAPGVPQSARFAGWVATGLLALLLVGTAGSLSRYYGDPAYSKTRGWRDLATTLARYTQAWPVDQVRLAQNFPDPTLWYYYRGPVEHLVLPPAAQDQAGAVRDVAALAAAGIDRVVIPLQPAAWWDDTGMAAQALSQHYQLVLETAVHGWPVQIYQRASQAMQRLDVQFANGSILAAAATATSDLVPGDVLAVSLLWHGAEAALSGDEKLTLQVLDQAGQVAAQHDQPFGVADLAGTPRVYGVPLPSDLAPGVYRLIVALYDPGQTGAPRLLAVTGADHVELGVFGKAGATP
jgi:hypothetical protein